jgi:putative ABC transport system permease protein
MFGRRAVVRGITQEVRTFTAAPFVFTSIKSAMRYDRRYREDEITYVLVRCAPGHDPSRVAESIRKVVPHVEVLTTNEFKSRTVNYWMLETGIGITVVLTAILGALVSIVVTSQTLFTITQEHLANYATLSALGFGWAQLLTCVFIQSLVLGGLGTVFGSMAFFFAGRVIARTPIPLETTPTVFTALVLVSGVCSIGSSYLAQRAVLTVDPVSVFRA